MLSPSGNEEKEWFEIEIEKVSPEDEDSDSENNRKDEKVEVNTEDTHISELEIEE